MKAFIKQKTEQKLQRQQSAQLLPRQDTEQRLQKQPSILEIYSRAIDMSLESARDNVTKRDLVLATTHMIRAVDAYYNLPKVTEETPNPKYAAILSTAGLQSFFAPFNLNAELVALLIKLILDQKIESLELFDTNLSSEALHALALALKRNTQVSTFTINGHYVNDEDMKVMAEALKVNRSLTTLVIEKHICTDIGAACLADALETNTAITSIQLDATASKISNPLSRKIAILLERNICFEKCSLMLEHVKSDGDQPTLSRLEKMRKIAEDAKQYSSEGLSQDYHNKYQLLDQAILRYQAEAERLEAARQAALQEKEKNDRDVSVQPQSQSQQVPVAATPAAVLVEQCGIVYLGAPNGSGTLEDKNIVTATKTHSLYAFPSLKVSHPHIKYKLGAVAVAGIIPALYLCSLGLVPEFTELSLKTMTAASTFGHAAVLPVIAALIFAMAAYTVINSRRDNVEAVTLVHSQDFKSIDL